MPRAQTGARAARGAEWEHHSKSGALKESARRPGARESGRGSAQGPLKPGKGRGFRFSQFLLQRRDPPRRRDLSCSVRVGETRSFSGFFFSKAVQSAV